MDRERTVHEAYLSNVESWKGSDNKINKAIDILTLKLFKLNSKQSIIVTKLKKQAIAKKPQH